MPATPTWEDTVDELPPSWKDTEPEAPSWDDTVDEKPSTPAPHSNNSIFQGFQGAPLATPGVTVSPANAADVWKQINTPLVNLIPNIDRKGMSEIIGDVARTSSAAPAPGVAVPQEGIRPIPNPNPESGAVGAAAGVQHGLAGLGNYFTSPLGIATLGMGALPKAVQRGVSLAFAAQMASEAPELAAQLGEATSGPMDTWDKQKVAELTTQALGTTAFATLAAKHGLAPERTVVTDPAAAAQAALNIQPRDRTPTVNPPQPPPGVDLQRYQNDPAYRAQVSGTEIPNENPTQPEPASPEPAVVQNVALPEQPVEPAQAVTIPKTPAAPVEIPLGINRPDLVDDSLKVLGEDEFDSHFKSAKKNVNEAEKQIDSVGDINELTPDQRQKIAAAQDIWSAASNERFRRNNEQIHTEDLFNQMIDLADKGFDFPKFKILADIIRKRGGAKPGDVTALWGQLPERLTGSADFREVAAGKLGKFKDWLQKASGESAPAVPVSEGDGSAVDEKPAEELIKAVDRPPKNTSKWPKPKNPDNSVVFRPYGEQGAGFYEVQNPKTTVDPKTDELLGTNNRGEPIYWSDKANTHYSISDGRVRTAPWLEGLPESALERLDEKISPAPAPTQHPANLPPSASMGGALPSELERGQGNPTAMKYKLIDQERQQRGLPPLTKPEGASDQAVMDKAMAEIDRNPKLPYDLTDELIKKPRTIDAWERMVLLLHKIDLRNAYEKSAREAAQAFDDSKQFPDREADMVRANLETNRLSDELSRVEQASRESGSQTGRALRSLQIMANEDYSLAALETSRRAAKGGAPLTDAERAELTKVAADYKAANEKLQKHIDETDKRLADAALKDALDKVEREAKNEPQIHPKIIQIAEKIVAGLDKRADAARQRIKERGFRFNTGVDPTVLRDVAEIGAAHLGHKILDFAKWSEKMISEFGDGIKPHLDEIFKASTKIIDDIKATPGVKRELKTPTPQERISNTATKVVEKLKEGKRDEISGDVNRIARLLLEHKLVDGREKLVDAIHAIISKDVPDITRREVQDALSGYGDFKQLTKDEISVKLRGYRGELQQIAKLEDMQAGKPPLKTGVERRSPTDDERALIKAVNEAKIKFQVPITDPATQLKSALDTRKTQIENQTKDLERRLAEGDFSKKPRRELAVDRRLQELTAARDAIRKKVRAAEIEARNKQRTGFEKTFDWISNARRFAVLSGNKVLLKLAAYSATKLPTMVATEAAGGLLGKLPYLRDVAERAPSEGGFSIRATTTAAAKFLTKGLDDAYKTAVEGHSDIKSAFSAKPELQRHWYDFAQAMHEVIKSPLRRAAFELSLAKRMEYAARKGTDITDPLVQMTLAKDAYLDSDRALLLENNRVASGIRGLIKQMEQKSKATGKPSLIGKAGATAARVELPILAVPLNYVRQTLMSAFGLISGSAKVARAFHNGIENLTPQEADSIMRHLKYGSIGGAMLLYGFYDGYKNGSNGALGGFYQPKDKRNKNQAQFGGARVGGVNISGVFLHNPMIAVAQLGHTMGAIAHQKVKKNDPEQRGITVGALAGTMGLLNESPLGRTTELISTLSDPHTSGQALNDHIKGVVIPQLVNEAAQFTDKPAQNLQDYFMMEPRKRDPHGTWQTLKTGVPILREQVPLKK